MKHKGEIEICCGTNTCDTCCYGQEAGYSYFCLIFKQKLIGCNNENCNRLPICKATFKEVKE